MGLQPAIDDLAGTLSIEGAVLDYTMNSLDPKLASHFSKWRWEPNGPFFRLVDPPEALMAQAVPADFTAALTEYGGREGFLGQCYLRLYRLAELLSVNEAFAVPRYAPGLLIFGSDGAGEAYAFELGTGRILMVPFVPLGMDDAQVVGNDFIHFVGRLADSGTTLDARPDRVGWDVWATHPIVFGGSPTDPSNKILVSPLLHAELAGYWNNLYRRLVEHRER